MILIGKTLMGRTASICLLGLLTATAALAQEAPPPRSMPRTPVSRQALTEEQSPVPSSREMQGPAVIMDGEKLRIGQTDLRLFGVVPPQLAASFGPQARAALDALAGGQNVLCKIRDRDREGHLLATCFNAGGNDMALDLLKRGLAVAARGSIIGTELAATYASAEQTAQSQRIGLWSVSTAAPVAAAPSAAPAPQSKPEAAAPEAEAKKEEKPRAPDQAAQAQAKVTADVLSQQAERRIDDAAWAASEEAGFFERYQILISGLLMLATALCITSALETQRIRDRREETKALAAALRGELMAARGVCFGRAKAITCDAEDRTAVWPRIRATLYQAYVGRLGLLGAELARQVASIYGQSSDYAALYNPATGTAALEVSKKQALETLLKRIDEVLPKLAEIERLGRISTSSSAPASGAENASAAAPDSSPESGFFFSVLSALFGAIGALRKNQGSLVPNPNSAAPPPLPPDPPHVKEYTAIIEADMERFQYAENVETLNVLPHKKRGKEKGAA
jgi:endonuclease YncB( thermonuclease family)